MAGLTDPSASRQELYAANVLPTKNMLEAARRERVGKFVHVSSTSVYGAPKALPCDESAAFAPIYAYGESKLEGEKLVSASAIPYVILRPSVLYGPAAAAQFEPLAEMLLSGKAAVIGGGGNRLAFVHERDVAKAIALALVKNAEGGFIISGGEELTQLRAWELVAGQMRVAPPARKVSLGMAKLAGLFSTLKARLAGKKPSFSGELLDVIVADRVFSIEKARRVLGWAPKEKFASALGEMAGVWRKSLQKP
jgi:nucleoside-diphosphate-sugar epimerase